MEHLMMRLVRPGTIITCGLMAVIGVYVETDKLGPDASFFSRHLLAFAMISWSAGLVLSLRLHFRRHGSRRGFFG